MRVDLEASVFAPAGRPHLDVLGLIALADRVGHTVATSATAVATWVTGLPGSLAGATELLLQTHRERLPDLSANAIGIRVKHGGATDWAQPLLNLDDAWLFLRTPLELLVENERADWAFLRRLASAGTQAQLDDALARGALAIRQGGGITEIKKTVEELTSTSGDPVLAKRRRIRRLRTWVLFDRDAAQADKALPSQHAEDCKMACSAIVQGDPWNISWSRLERRHIESYLPDSVLADWATARTPLDASRVAALQALRNADPSTAGSINMKGGLIVDLPKPRRDALSHTNAHLNVDSNVRRASEQTVAPAEWPPPFGAVAADTRADLLSGFGREIAELFTTANSTFDPDFPLEFDRGAPAVPAAALVESIMERL